MKSGASDSGFTLLEVLVTLSIVAGVIAVVLACFEGGFRVYARIRDFGNREADVFLAGEMLEQDLGYLIPAAEYRFDSRDLQFFRAPLLGGEVERIQVSAPDGGGLLYWVGSAASTEASRAGMAVVSDGLDVVFSYADPADSDAWLPAWDSNTNLPSAVRMTVRDLEGGGRVVVKRTMVLTHVLVEEDEE